MGKKVRKIGAMLDPGHKVFKSFGLPDPVGDKVHGEYKTLTPAERAAESAKAGQDQQAELSRQQEIIAANATALAANSAVENTATVVAGGSADAVDSGTDVKRKRVASMSSTLGV